MEILLALFCGLGKGEIVGLKFSDFDLDDKFVRINRQLVKDAFLSDNPDALRVKIDKYELIEKPPKKDSYRTLRIPKVIITEVKRRKRKQEECKEYYKDFVDYDYISFQEKTGSEINGIKHSDIDYIHRKLFVRRQLGKKKEKNKW